MKQLPDVPHLDHLKKQAKELLRAYEQSDSSALRRFLTSLPAVQGGDPAHLATRQLRLHDAQYCIAREYGFASWAELKAYVDWKSAGRQDRDSIVQRWLALVYGLDGDPRPKLAIRLLRERPDLPGDDPYFACAVGDEARLRRALASNAAWANEAGGALAMPPLVAVTHSGLVRDVIFAGGLMRCAKLLLDYGASPDQTWVHSGFPDSRLSALYGAAGKNHHAGMTQLLLDHGANPNDNESLYHSVESSDLSCTRLLLEAGAQVDGTHAIGRVLDYDRLEGLRLLFMHGGDAGKPGASEFPIFHAIRRGRSPQHIQLLLDAGADTNVVNAEGMTPYRFALSYGLPEVAAMLRRDEHDASLTIEDKFVAACACGEREAALRQLADDPHIVNRLSAKQLRQLPNMAAQSNLKAVELMVEVGWPIAVNGGDWGASALNLAVYRGQAAMAEFLLAYGASWEEKHGFGGNVMGTLSFASKADNIETDAGDWLACARALIAHGMPLPPEEYEFSEDVAEYFESLSSNAGT